VAELVERYPDRFAGFLAAVPMTNPEAAVNEIQRAVRDLRPSGVQIYSNVGGRPIDLPEPASIYDLLHRRRSRRSFIPHGARGSPTTRARTAPDSRGPEFFGTDHVLFASDCPDEPTPGVYIRETLEVVAGLDLSASDYEKVTQSNARRLMPNLRLD
jgi:predicted TIM-barrel fold metal-dependent hydrolase